MMDRHTYVFGFLVLCFTSIWAITPIATYRLSVTGRTPVTHEITSAPKNLRLLRCAIGTRD